MERYQKIGKHKKFKKYLKQIQKLEKNRIYCCHGLEHLMDVARLAYIKALEEEISLSKDMIYGAALLHDLGKVDQYKKGIPHEVAGAQKMQEILSDCGYESWEIEIMKSAVLHHRRGGKKAKSPLSRLLYDADKASRMCMFCKGRKTCHWTKEEKNSLIEY